MSSLFDENEKLMKTYSNFFLGDVLWWLNHMGIILINEGLVMNTSKLDLWGQALETYYLDKLRSRSKA